jgi:hypothetical protein
MMLNVNNSVQFVDNVHEMLVPETNPPNGNCLFHSMSEALFGHVGEHVMLRKRVSEFYKGFNAEATLSDANIVSESMLYRIALSVVGDMYDDDGKLHSTNIKRGRVWGNQTDLMILCLLYNVNVVLCQREKVACDTYTIAPFITAAGAVTVYMRLCESHFEAMLPIIGDPTLIGKRVTEMDADDELLTGVVTRFDNDPESATRFKYMVQYEDCDNEVGRTEYQIKASLN